jgi:hypothetical protein
LLAVAYIVGEIVTVKDAAALAAGLELASKFASTSTLQGPVISFIVSHPDYAEHADKAS